jgi:hypothetical protein
MLLFNEVLNGWRKTGAIFFVLIWTLTLTLLILFLVSFFAVGSFTETTLYLGSCTQSSRNVLILHLFINIVSTAVLTSSNFFLQLLAAPTRDDIDKAHRRARWLDVGIPSLRNLRFVSWLKLTLWLLIAITSLPLHLLFNSSVYDTDAETEFIVVLASEGFVKGGNYSLPGIGWEFLPEYEYQSENANDSEPFLREIGYIAKSAAGWQNLDASQCYDAYIGASSSSGPLTGRDRRHLVIILAGDNNSTGWNISSELNQEYIEMAHPVNDTTNTLWDAEIKSTAASPNTAYACCGDYFNDPASLQSGSEWEFEWPTPDEESGESFGNVTALYCLSEQIEGFCKTQISNMLFFVVFLCCLGKSVFCTVTIFYLWHSRPLSTVGDAVESFICTPDPTTKGMCTFGWRDFSRSARWTAFPRLWRSRKMYCGTAVPLFDWLFVYILSILVLATSITLLVIEITQGFWYVYSPRQLSTFRDSLDRFADI